MTRHILLLTSCVVLFLSGCGESTSTVSGTLTFDGKPLNAGFILFQTAEGKVLSADIQPDGTYALEQVGPGTVKIAVSVPSPPARGPDGVSADAPEAFDIDPVVIPAKYGAVETSGLTYEVESGTQVHDIGLE